MNSSRNTKFIVIAFTLLYIMLNAFCIVKGFLWLNLLPLALLLGYMLFFQFERYIYLLIALLPISVPLRYLVSGLPFDISLPAEILIIFGLLFFILKVLHDNHFDKNIILHPVTIAILLNITWMFITSMTSTLPLVSFKFLASRIWFVVVFYFVLLLLFSKYKRFFTYLWCYSIPFIFVMLYSIKRLMNEGVGDTVVNTANKIVMPFFPDHTSYAAAIAMLIPILIFVFIIKKRAGLPMRLFIISVFVIFFIALVFSYTRAAWLSLIVAFGFMVATMLKIKLRTTLLIGASIGLFLFLSWTQIQISLSQNKQDSSSNLLKHVQSVSNVSTDASNLERINRWHCAIEMFKDKPFLGFGPGTYMFKYAPYQVTRERTIISTNSGTLGNSHSEYLGPLAEGGIFGSITFLAIVLTTVFTSSRVYFTAKRRKVRYLSLALMVGFLSYCFHGIMNNFLDIDKLNGLFWGFVAMIVALDLYHNKLKEKKRSIFFY